MSRVCKILAPFHRASNLVGSETGLNRGRAEWGMGREGGWDWVEETLQSSIWEESKLVKREVA